MIILMLINVYYLLNVVFNFVYLHAKQFGFHPYCCLNKIRWLNKVNGGDEFWRKEKILFERLFLPQKSVYDSSTGSLLQRGVVT